MEAGLRYLRNRAIYGVWLKRPPTPLELQQPAVRWDPPATSSSAAAAAAALRAPAARGATPAPGRADVQAGAHLASSASAVAVEHPELPGLWLLRRALDPSAVSRMGALFAGLACSGRASWFRYNFGRDMLPLHASPALDAATARRVLPGHVFGEEGTAGADPVSGWPHLQTLLSEGVEGAQDLLELQRLPARHVRAFADQPCLFIQAQALEPGAEVTAHKDPLPDGGHLIATAVIEGSSDVRVGSVRFRVDAGDVYFLADDARYEVEHEILASAAKRVSITLRYGLDFRPGYELRPMGGDAPAVPEGSSLEGPSGA
eukprot:TRINITY_DN3575_c0_g1_i1.p1 TRINITY_DN3575_c0_g1~~TRINITY_DN3575_c0_g1_i1.p1  ORF type:complete len:327 (-),score=55.63 TRINITY_DN3575_c0_g1_i1:140-1090(-)